MPVSAAWIPTGRKGPGEPRRQPGRADGVLRHRGALVPEWDHRGTPWDNPEGYTKQNPIDYVKNWKTPMLVVHGGRDYRIPDTQGMSVFTALQRRGVPSQFLYFPDENHWELRPTNSIQWHETVLAWLERWLTR